MKSILGVLFVLVSVSANAGTCDLITGHFKTKTTECYTIHNGGKYGGGYMEISAAFNEKAKSLNVDMVSRNYSLNYLVNGKEQIGRPQLEGIKYSAQCENNHAHIRADIGLKYLINYDYSINSDGNLVYQETVEGGSNFIRVCEMDRI